MKIIKICLLLFIQLIVGGNSKDVNDSYEFGFTIDGQQHRHESKDVNGIIQGEFGFITADGVYHVTVYATDENGNFRILSMKNIRLSGPLDGSDAFGKNRQISTTPKPDGGGACADCSYQPIAGNQNHKTEESRIPASSEQTLISTTKSPYQQGCADCVLVPVSQNNNQLNHKTEESRIPTGNDFQNQNNPFSSDLNNNNSPSINLNPPSFSPQNPIKDVTVSDNTIHVPGHPDIPIQDKYPGMVDGLPNGIKENDITDLLYKFNYTVGFHGHYEKGYKNGAKIGGYFVNGRDGLSQVVTYVADENGFRPKFKYIRLGLDSDDTPKEATEKSFGLKHFEFIWYPID